MKRMPLPTGAGTSATFAMAIGYLVHFDPASADVEFWQLGGDAGQIWSDVSDGPANVLMDDFTIPTALQPRELDPEVNIVTQLGSWYGFKFPADLQYRDGQPRIWRGVNSIRQDVQTLKFVDDDPESALVITAMFAGVKDEFYTLDLGGMVPVERFRFYPPDGIDHITDQPYRPFYNPVGFELSAGSDAQSVRDEGIGGFSEYQSLETVLFTARQHHEPTGIVDITFPLQYHRFFRIRAFPESMAVCRASGLDIDSIIEQYGLVFGENWLDFPCIRRLGWAEMEIYGRGFVPEASWESRVLDLGGELNIGRVIFATSTWRREEEGQLVPAPDAAARAEVELRTGVDDDPVAWFTFNKRGGHVQVTAEEYRALRVNRPEIDPKHVGFRGPVTHDHENWSFWSAPMSESGSRPRVRPGRFFQVRVKLQTDKLWEFVRLDSLALEISPLLADRIVAEIADSDDLHPAGNLTKVRAGEMTEFVYDVRADFSGEDKAGFDAVRLLTHAQAEFHGLEMGAPLQKVAPDEIIDEATGFTVYLPRTVEEGEPPLRIRFESALYGASGTFAGEVFERDGDGLPQAIQAGDVSGEVGTNRLQVVAIPSSLGDVLGSVVVEPPIFTPQGDGINETARIGYSMLSVQAGIEVEVSIFTLSGVRVWSMQSDTQGAGRHSVPWDGRDDHDLLVPPGVYLTRVKVATSEGDFERLRRVAVVY